MRNSLSLLFVCLSSVTLTAAPQLRLSSNTIGPIYVENGSNALPQGINAFNLGDGTLNLAVVSTSASWLSAAIGQPGICSGGPVAPCVPVTINFNTAGLAIGNYSESFTLNDPNAIDSPQIVTVQLQVNGSPTSADLYVTPNNGQSTAQSDTASLIINTGSAVLSTITTTDNGAWLTFTLGGNHIVYTSYQLRVTAQPGQPEGTYTGTVVLSGSNSSADNKAVNVGMHVTSQPILQIPTSPITFNLVQGQAPQTYNVAFQNLGLGSLSISGATTSGGSWLSASAAGGTSANITADPGALSAGSYFGSVTLASNAANTGVPVPVRVNVMGTAGPTVAFGGVVDNAGFVNGQAVASGSIAAVFGTQLSTTGPANASGFPLPTTLGGVQVLVNGVAVPLFYTDANQADVQIPFGLVTASVLVQVLRNGQPSNRVSATVDSVAPRLFALRQLPGAPDGNAYGAVLNSDATLALPANLAPGSHPARPGDVLTIFALGLGPVSPAVNTGAPAPSVEPLARTTNAVQLVYGSGTGGSVTANTLYSGLAPFFAGLYQINVLLPQGVPTGNVPVTISMQGHVSNIVDMAVATQ
jgi:uncharacterized protein (TIGR03437 family)